MSGPMREHDRRGHQVARGALACLLGMAGVVGFGVVTQGTAGAAIGPVGVSPSSGPPGTAVTVSGSGCGPGLIRSPSQDYVSVSSTSLPLGVQVPVDSGGSWSTTFTVPPGTLPLPAAIAALCITDGLPSLVTIYTPGTFTVTAASPPATSPPPTTPPATTVPTSPTTGGTSNPTTPTSKGKPGSKSDAGSPTGSGSSAGDGNGSGSGARRSGSDSEFATLAGTIEDLGSGDGSGTAAGLRSPRLASDSTSADGGLGWWWLLVLVLAGAVGVGAWAWWRSRRGPGPGDAMAAPEGETDPTPDHADQDAAPDFERVSEDMFPEAPEEEFEVVGLYDGPASNQ
jgi:hypothetical protein